MAHVSITHHNGAVVTVQDDMEGVSYLRDVALGILERAAK